MTEHDGLKDSWWDKAKDWSADQWDALIRWVHQHAGALGKIADAAGWIATALATVVIVLSILTTLGPLLGPLLITATVFTVVSLAAHTLLGLSGDGSWVDVGYDLIAVATFGYGKIALKAAQGSKQGRLHAQRVVKEAMEVQPSTMVKVGHLDGPLAELRVRADALAALAPGSAKAQSANQSVATSVRKAVVASGIGVVSDVLDRSGASNRIKPSFTFGRYASR